MAILVNDFRLEEHPEYVEASCALKGEGFPDRLRFRVPLENAHAIDMEEPNWAAMALYWQALMMEQDLVIEADLSPLLLHSMRGNLMALMRNYEPMLKDIRIDAGFSTSPIPEGPRDVMTGFSGGVDSFSTFVLYSGEDVPPSMKLTALAVYQVGALGPTSSGDNLLKQAVAHAGAQAKDHGLKQYAVWANMDDVYAPARQFGPTDFRRTVGLRNAAAALLLQNGVKLYLPSGSVSYRLATYGPYNCTENMDPVFQPLVATEKLRVQAAGAGLSRRDKLRLLVDHPEAQKRLNVCVISRDTPRPTTKLNCTRCWKCAQTLMVLDAFGAIDNFEEVFDLDHYRANRNGLLQYLADEAYGGRWVGLIEDIIWARQNGVPVPKARSTLEKRLRGIARRALKGS